MNLSEAERIVPPARVEPQIVSQRGPDTCWCRRVRPTRITGRDHAGNRHLRLPMIPSSLLRATRTESIGTPRLLRTTKWTRPEALAIESITGWSSRTPVRTVENPARFRR